MSLLHEVERILTAAAYDARMSTEPRSSLYFEDYNILGFCAEYETVESLIASWLRNQETFLTIHAPSLRRASQKAWNCYTIHLTPALPTESELRQLLAIEEDFRSTRKIARGGVSTPSDLTRTLYPVLPIQNLVQLQSAVKPPDLSERLRWPAPAIKALLGNGSPNDILDLLQEQR